MNMDKSRTSNKAAVDFVSNFNEIYFRSISHILSSFVQNGFLKELFEKNPSAPADKGQILIRRFGNAAKCQPPTQAEATNIQPTTLSLIFSIAFYAASKSWDNFSFQFLSEFGDIHVGSNEEDDMLDDSSVDEPDKAQPKPKTKNTPDKKKSGKTGKVPDSFLKNLFDKNPSKTVDNTQLLIQKFGDTTNLANFTSQDQATNIQPTTLSLIFSIALYVSSRSWETFVIKYYMTFGNMGEIAYDEGVTDDGEYELSLDGLDEDEIHQIIDNKIEIQTPNPVDDTPPTKNTLDKKISGKTGKDSVSNKSKKKDKQQSSTKALKNNNELKNPTTQKKAKKSLKNGVGGNNDNKECVWANLHGEVSSRGAPLFNGSTLCVVQVLENFCDQVLHDFGDMGDVAYDDSVTDDGLDESSEDGLDEDKINFISKSELQTPNP
ncbi:hypothetical protein RhiirA4_430360, partial [Rhizophagus irregularis]